MLISILFFLGCDKPSGFIFFVPTLLLSILAPLFLPSSSVYLSYFILAVPMRECLSEIAMLWPKLRLSKSNQTITI